MAQYELNLRDYWLILRKRKWIILFTVLLVAGFTFFTTEVFGPTPTYEASARVKFDRSTSMSGLMTEVLLGTSEGGGLTTQAEVIQSVPVMFRAAKKLGVIAKEIESNEVRTKPDVLAKIYQLKGHVAVAQEGTTNILRITTTAEEPESTALLANAVAEGYREENIASRNRQVDEAKLFVADQLKTVEEALRKSEQGLLAFREHEGKVFLNEEARQALENYSRLDAELEKLGQVKREASNQLRLLKANEALPESGPVRVFSDDVQALIAKLNQKLVDLNTDRAALLINYMPKHPLVVELDAKIRSVKQEMIKELESKFRTLTDRENAVQASIKRFRERYITLPKAALEQASLDREVKINGDLYANLKQKHQEFLIRGAERIEEVTIIEPAVTPGAPKNAPKAALNLMLSSLIGMLLGFVLAFVRESMDTSIGTIEGVDEFLKAPVLGVIPQVDRTEIEQTIQKVFPEMLAAKTVELLSRLAPLFDLKGVVAEGYRSLK